jgi:hypothetical protein
MRWLTRYDEWAGRTLFVPPIIALCQATGWSQYAVHRYTGTLFFLILIAAIGWPETVVQWIIFVLFSLGAIILILTSVFMPDRPRPPSNLRVFFLVWITGLHISGLLALVLDGNTDYFSPYRIADLMLLFSEYALTIPKIPPRDDEKVTRVARARS